MLNSGKSFHPIAWQLRHVPSQFLKRQEYHSTEQGLGLALGCLMALSLSNNVQCHYV